MTPRTGRFSKADRLRRSREFQRVSREGRRAASSAFVVLLAPAEREDEDGVPLRLGVTVSRRVGNAVVRNRVKRRIREWFRRCRDELPGRGDLVVIARAQAAQLSSARSDAVLCQLAAKASAA